MCVHRVNYAETANWNAHTSITFDANALSKQAREQWTREAIFVFKLKFKCVLNVCYSCVCIIWCIFDLSRSFTLFFSAMRTAVKADALEMAYAN